MPRPKKIPISRGGRSIPGGDSLLGTAAIILLTFAAYSPVTRAGFVWDDDVHFAANPAMEIP
ncbi:hypothetical protein HYR69_00565 [Candidatus Sumerlaeota bacterium]|nr:hypothetical protein [Candidatus Sumerlaeota bacterium]